MASWQETYIDPSIAGNSGSGTVGDPYGDVQYALDQVTRDATNGDRFNIKSGTDEILSAILSLATFGTPAIGAPLIFEGYDTAAGDGGVGGISGNGSVGVAAFGTTAVVHWRNLHLHNTGSNRILDIDSNYGSVVGCELSNTGSDAIEWAFNKSYLFVLGCHFHDIGGSACNEWGNGAIHCCYFKNDGTRTMSSAIRSKGNVNASGNIISVDGASHGILHAAASHQVILANSILSSSGTGTGIHFDNATATNVRNCLIANNLVEGFSGTGGRGIAIENGGYENMSGHNAVYNNATNYDITAARHMELGDNETLSGSPFDKSGADSFANRFTYFNPADVGNVLGGAYDGRSDKGAVQTAHDAGGGGGGGGLMRLGWQGGMVG